MNTIHRILQTYFRPLLRQIEASGQAFEASQQRTFRMLMQHVAETQFGKEHSLTKDTTYETFRRNVPVREYNDIQPYIDRLRAGEDYILWDERVHWFAKSSGTSSDRSKFIPITSHNLTHCHYRGFQAMVATYLRNNPDSKMFLGKSLTLGGSVTPNPLTGTGKTQSFSGDLSAILLKNSPAPIEITRTPGRATALIGNFEEKIARICKECSQQNVTNFAGVPSWNLILLNQVMEYNHANNLLDIWPNLELFMHGGTHFEPYREQFRRLIPSDRMHYVENYNASEGYFAFQDEFGDPGMRLALDNGVFYEFIPQDKVEAVLQGDLSHVLPLEAVVTGQSYALVISTDSGLWRYLIGDCVRFVNTHPHKLIITGRTQLFINLFGEELMIGNTEKALSQTCQTTGAVVSEYSVAPMPLDKQGKGGHEWVVEFEQLPEDEDLEAFAGQLDQALCEQNSDYEAKRKGTMNALKLTCVPKGTFYRWMEQRGKTGGQNKVPRLFPERKFVEALKEVASQL